MVSELVVSAHVLSPASVLFQPSKFEWVYILANQNPKAQDGSEGAVRVTDEAVQIHKAISLRLSHSIYYMTLRPVTDFYFYPTFCL